MSAAVAPTTNTTLTPWIPEVNDECFKENILYVRIRKIVVNPNPEFVFVNGHLDIDVRFWALRFSREHTNLQVDDKYYDLSDALLSLYQKMRGVVELFLGKSHRASCLTVDFVGVPDETTIVNEALPAIRKDYLDKTLIK